MKSAWVSLGMAVVAISCVFISAASAKQHKGDHLSHRGTFVSASEGKMVMTDRHGKIHNHAVAKNAMVMIDGKAGALSGLKKGTAVSVTTDKSGTVTAISTVAAHATKPTTTAKPASNTTGVPAATKPANSTPPVAPSKAPVKS